MTLLKRTAGEKVAFSVHQTVPGGVWRDDRLAQSQSDFQALADEPSIDLLDLAGEHPHGDGAARIQVADAERAAVSGNNLDERSRWPLAVDCGNGAREHPGVPGAHRPFTVRFEPDRDHAGLT